MAKKNVTFADIAAYTGFSKTTISRYFNNPDSITVENQEKIANALEVLDYKENKLARVMANGKTEMVGVIIPNLYMHYYSDMLDHIISTYEEYGYKFIVFAGNEDADVERRYIQELLAYKTEGLIILSHTLASEELAEYHIPIVTIEREDEHVCSVNTDNYMGGVQAATVLAKSSCDILIHANADFPNTIPAYGRIQGFQDFCETNGLEHRIMIRDFGASFEENSAEITKLLQEIEEIYPEKKVGIFMPNDPRQHSAQSYYTKIRHIAGTVQNRWFRQLSCFQRGDFSHYHSWPTNGQNRTGGSKTAFTANQRTKKAQTQAACRTDSQGAYTSSDPQRNYKIKAIPLSAECR